MLRAGGLVCAELLGGSLRLGGELRPDYGGRERRASELVTYCVALARYGWPERSRLELS